MGIAKKKSDQLKMNISTASGKLTKDILFDLICRCNVNKCHHCGLEMTRDTFSIEHIIPWLDSENPIELFFSLDNIAFSHLKCNIKMARRSHKYPTEEERLNAKRASQRKCRENNPEKYRQTRRDKYLRLKT